MRLTSFSFLNQHLGILWCRFAWGEAAVRAWVNQRHSSLPSPPFASCRVSGMTVCLAFFFGDPPGSDPPPNRPLPPAPGDMAEAHGSEALYQAGHAMFSGFQASGRLTAELAGVPGRTPVVRSFGSLP